MLPVIRGALERIPAKGQLRIGDLFSGTASVSRLFKQLGHSVVANDNLEFCYALAMAVLQINVAPNFAGLEEEITNLAAAKLFTSRYDQVLQYLNSLVGVSGFIFKEYAPGGQHGEKFSRKYFSNNNARKIDAIREKIAEWHEKEYLTPEEYYLLVSDLIRATNRVANIAGTYGTFMKYWDPRALKPIFLDAAEITDGKAHHQVFCADANSIARTIECDVLYLDPPYTWRHYGAYYHILETIAKWDAPEVTGKTGLRPWESSKSRYCDRSDAVNALSELVSHAECDYILLSYNSEGLISHEQIMDVLKLRGRPSCEEIDYRRYKSNNSGNKGNHVKERLYYVSTK
jgi:adenine-specific DNA-methyltransferase